MIISTTDTIPGREIAEILGVCRGNVVRAKHLGKDIMAGLKGIVGGEISEYTELMTEARDQAFNRMVAEARAQGADAVVNVRFVTSMIAQTMSELLAYGTAVTLKP
ncbi:MAG: YbjQ family protein [Lentisphaeria bacterium]|nr:YbjQ family protein [Lentisphaeria bacterium]